MVLFFQLLANPNHVGVFFPHLVHDSHMLWVACCPHLLLQFDLLELQKQADTIFFCWIYFACCGLRFFSIAVRLFPHQFDDWCVQWCWWHDGRELKHVAAQQHCFATEGFSWFNGIGTANYVACVFVYFCKKTSVCVWKIKKKNYFL